MYSSEFFNLLDYIYIGIMLLSAMVGLFRGFSKDFFGTCAWLLSGFLSVFAAPMLYQSVGRYITNDMLLRGTCLIMAFLMLLAIFLLITSLISSRVKESVFSGVDRAAGALFGLFRGMCIIFAFCAIMVIFEVPQDRFSIVADSKISSIVFEHAEEFASFLEKIKLVPKGYLNKINFRKAKKTKTVRQMAPKITVKKSADDSQSSFNVLKKKIVKEVEKEVAPKPYLSLSEAIAKRKRERQRQLIDKSMPDDRNAD